MIGLHCMLQNECTLLLYIHVLSAKLTNYIKINDISPNKGGQILSSSIKYCYLTLNPFKWGATAVTCCWIPLSIQCFCNSGRPTA